MKSPLLLGLTLGWAALCRADAVRLHIVGPDGKPVAGAKVRVIEWEGSWFARKKADALDLTADGAGALAFESKGKLTDPANYGGGGAMVWATVRAPGLATTLSMLRAGDNKIALEAGRSLEGTLLDAAQQPVAGVRVVVSGAEPLAQATSDANGRFCLEALPAKGVVSLQVDDPKWRSESFPVDMTRPVPPPFFLERGATLKGRVLRPDGTPAGGVRLFAGNYERQPTTRADGTFEATGLSEAEVYLQIVDNDQKLPFVLSPKSASGLKAGQTRDSGDWKAQKGVRIRARVVASDTKKPIPDAYLSLFGGGYSQGQGDATGAFDFQSVPDFSQLSVGASGFVGLSKAAATNAKNGVVDLGILELTRGKKVEGTLVDDKGNALANRTLNAAKKNANMGGDWARTDDKGHFSFDGLEAGEYTITAQGLTLASGQKFSVGAAPLPTLRVVAAGGGAGQTVAHKITGMVRDDKGQPVAGAKIGMTLMTSDNSSMSPSALSQLDGSFATDLGDWSAGRLTISGVKRPGFVVSARDIKQVGDEWHVQIAVQPKGAALRGRVVDAAGQGVAGAWVGVQNDATPPVATDKAGEFALPDAPLQNVTLLASNGPSLASYTVKAGDKVQIALPAAPPAPDKAALADKMLQGAGLGYEWEKAWDVLGRKRIEAVVADGGIGGGSSDINWAWSQYLLEYARRAPKEFVAREEELRERVTPQYAAQFEQLLMRARAGVGDDAQKSLVRAYLAKQEKQKRAISAQTVSELLQLARIGAALDAKTGQMWLDYADAIAAQLPDYAGDDANEWGTLLAQTRKDVPLSFGESWKLTIRLQILQAALAVYAQSDDLDSARAAWRLSQQLAEQSAQNPAADIAPKPYRQNTADIAKEVTTSYAKILAHTDPKGALALAAIGNDYRQAELLNTIARAAIALKQPDIAKRAIEAQFEVPLGNVEFVAEAAGIAQSFDPAFAATVWPRAYDKARPRAENGGGYQPSLAAYAGARAATFPGESRLFIEREWQDLLERQAAKPTPTDADNTRIDFDQNGQTQSALVEAMAKVAPERALEMLDKVPKRENLRAQTRLAIALALLKP